MDGGRHDTLSDARLDRELDAALNVEPSPEFVARIRTRVAEEPIRAPWFAGWHLAAAGAVTMIVAAVVAGALMWGSPSGGPTSWGRAAAVPSAPLAPPVAALAQPASTPTPPVAPMPADPAASAPAAPAVERLRPRPVPPTPPLQTAVAVDSLERPPFEDVLVPPDQRLALNALLATLSRRETVAVQPTAPALGEEAPAITIEPIVIEDVAIVALLE